MIKNLAIPRQDGPADHPLHGRGAVPRRPGRGDRRRPHRRRGPAGHPRPDATRARARSATDCRPGCTPPAGLDGAARCPDGLRGVAPDDLTAALHRLTGWAIEHRRQLDDLEIMRPSLEDVYLELSPRRRSAADRTRRGGRTAVMRRGADALAGALREQGVLAKSGVGVLHLRVPADVPGDLHRAARAGHGPRSAARGDTIHLLRRGHGHVRGDHRLLQQHRDQPDRPTRQRASSSASTARRCRAASFLAARVLHALFVAVLLVAITGGVRPGRVQRRDPDRRSRCFGSWSCSWSARPASARSASPSPRSSRTPTPPLPIVNATILPLLFLSGVFIPLGDNAPAWICGRPGSSRSVTSPRACRPASSAPRSTGPTCSSSPPGGSAGLVLASRYFSWEPRTG